MGMLAACVAARPAPRAGAGGAPALVASLILHLGVGAVALAEAGLRATSPALPSSDLAVTVEIVTAGAAPVASVAPAAIAPAQAAALEHAGPASPPSDPVPPDPVPPDPAAAESLPAAVPESELSNAMPPAAAGEGSVPPPRRAPRSSAARAAAKPKAAPVQPVATASAAPPPDARPATGAVPPSAPATVEPSPPTAAAPAHPGAGARAAAADAPLPLLVTAPRYREPPAPPVYPRRARELDQQGVVLVRALLDSAGNPDEVLVFQSSGYALLDRAAQDAVRRWRFVPARQNGRESAAWVQVPVRFSLQ
ncbi:MAG: energy transducer TonB [Alphaproteobacteria bacterium]|nr:energy transducer TonB [Alphaproteobacteria bacterium]